jgi:hypothetical protein
MLPSRRIFKALPFSLASSLLVLLALGASSALAGPTVTVRVEGEAATLLVQTTVTLNAPEPTSKCPANSVAAAIDLAVGGNWDHGEAEGAAGNFTQTILGETHAFANEGDTWAEWVDYKWGGGICTDLLSEGDEVLMIADHEPSPTFAPTRWPLLVGGAPASVQVGVPFKVQISEVRTPAGAFAEAGQGTPTPLAGATITGPGVSSTPSDASGTATVTIASAGSVALRASKAGDAPSATFLACAHSGNDGLCGTSAPGATTTSAGTGSTTGAYKGPYALVAKATGLLDGHVYARGRGPKVLAGTVATHARIASVALKLRRSYRGRCSAYNGTRGQFTRTRCGTGSFFGAGMTPSFSYLLPAALAPGRYVLDIEATDVNGNHTSLARGTSRIVFYVR